nr:immunoglobulin heavy chain junction region [Homo sapiens]
IPTTARPSKATSPSQ